ncbi:MAG: hypothetical protein ABR499_20360 [Gemmatimonadaceae bacterium]
MRATSERVLCTLAAVLTLALATLVATPRAAYGQDPAVRDTARADSAQMYILRTRDGSLFVGRLIRATVDSVYFVSSGGPITVPRSSILELRQVGRGAMRAGIYWAPNPNETRLFIAPTGRMLAQGEGYFSDTYLFLLLFAGGLSSNFTLGGGLSILPSDDFFRNNIYYITPKIGLIQKPNVNVAAGAFIGFAGWDFDGSEDVGSFGILYGVATFGSADGSVTIGSGLGYGGGDLADRPIFMLGGEKRIARRASLVTENYVLPGESNAAVSYGIRFFGEKLAVDLAFWNAFGSDVDPIFPGIPYVAFAVKF